MAFDVGSSSCHYFVLDASTRDDRSWCHWEDTVTAEELVVTTKG